MFVYVLIHLLIEETPFEEVSENSFDPSVVFMSLAHHEEDLALKSPAITDKYGLHLLISLIRFTKLDKNESNSLLSWLVER